MEIMQRYSFLAATVQTCHPKLYIIILDEYLTLFMSL